MLTPQTLWQNHLATGIRSQRHKRRPSTTSKPGMQVAGWTETLEQRLLLSTLDSHLSRDVSRLYPRMETDGQFQQITDPATNRKVLSATHGSSAAAVKEDAFPKPPHAGRAAGLGAGRGTGFVAPLGVTVDFTKADSSSSPAAAPYKINGGFLQVKNPVSDKGHQAIPFPIQQLSIPRDWTAKSNNGSSFADMSKATLAEVKEAFGAGDASVAEVPTSAFDDRIFTISFDGETPPHQVVVIRRGAVIGNVGLRESTPVTLLTLSHKTTVPALGNGGTITQLSLPNTFPLPNVKEFTPISTTMEQVRDAPRLLRGYLSTPAVDARFEPLADFNAAPTQEERNVNGYQEEVDTGYKVVTEYSQVTFQKTTNGFNGKPLDEYILRANVDANGNPRPITILELGGMKFTAAPGSKFKLVPSNGQLAFESAEDDFDITAFFEGGSITYRLKKDSIGPAVHIDLRGGGNVTTSSTIEFVSAEIGGVKFDKQSGLTDSLSPLTSIFSPTDTITFSGGRVDRGSIPEIFDGTAGEVKVFPSFIYDPFKVEITPKAQGLNPEVLQLKLSSINTSGSLTKPRSLYDNLEVKFYGLDASGKEVGGQRLKLTSLSDDDEIIVNTQVEHPEALAAANKIVVEFFRNPRRFASVSHLPDVVLLGRSAGGAKIESILKPNDPVSVIGNRSTSGDPGPRIIGTDSSFELARAGDVKIQITRTDQSRHPDILQLRLNSLPFKGTFYGVTSSGQRLAETSIQLLDTRGSGFTQRIPIQRSSELSSAQFYVLETKVVAAAFNSAALPKIELLETIPPTVSLNLSNVSAIGAEPTGTASSADLKEFGTNSTVANPVRFKVPSAEFKIRGGVLQPIEDVAVVDVETGVTTIASNGNYSTTYNELKLQPGGNLKLSYYKRHTFDGNGVLLTPGNSLGLYGGQVPFEIPAVTGVMIGAPGKFADLGDKVRPGILIRNGELDRIRFPIQEVTVENDKFAGANIGGTRGLTLTQFAQKGKAPQRMVVEGGGAFTPSSGLFKSEIRSVFGGTNSEGLELLPESDTYNMSFDISGFFLLGQGVAGFSQGMAVKRDGNGKFKLTGGALFILASSDPHTAAEINSGNTSGNVAPKGKVVRGRFDSDTATGFSDNEFNDSSLTVFIGDPKVTHENWQGVPIHGYLLKPRASQANPLRLTVSANEETLRGKFSVEAGGGVLLGELEPVTLVGGKITSSQLLVDFSTKSDDPAYSFVAKGIVFEGGPRAELQPQLALPFQKATLNGTVLADRSTNSNDLAFIQVGGRRLTRGIIRSTNRQVGDVEYQTLSVILSRNSVPHSWNFSGPATYFGQQVNVGAAGASNPKMTLGDAQAGEQVKLGGFPDPPISSNFDAPPFVRIAGLTFDTRKMALQGTPVEDPGVSKTYTYKADDIDVNLGVTSVPLSMTVKFKVSSSGVEVESLSGSLRSGQKLEIGNASLEVKSLSFDYDKSKAQFQFHGDAKFQFEAGGAAVDLEVTLGDQSNPGLVVKDGVVESFKATVNGGFSVLGLSVQAHSLTVAFNRNTNSFAMYGGVSVSTAAQGGFQVIKDLHIGLGNERSPGLLIKGGRLTALDFAITAEINLFSVTAKPDNLRVRYDAAGNRLQITGSLEVTLAPKLTLTASLPGEGLLINTSTGAVQIKGLSLAADSDIKFGVMTLKEVHVDYEEDSGGNVTIGGGAEVELPSGLAVGAEFKIINGKLDTIGISFEKNPGILVAQGLINIFRIEGKISGLSDLSNFRLEAAVTASVGPLVKFAGESHALALVKGTIIVTPQDLTLKGNVLLVNGLFGEGNFEGKLIWTGTPRATFNADVTLLQGTVTGKMNAYIDIRGNVDFNAKMQVQVPDGVPKVGGSPLGSLQVELRVRPAEAPTASYGRFSLSRSFGPLTLSGSIKIDFARTVEFGLAGRFYIDLPKPLPDIDKSVSFRGSFRLFDGARPTIQLLAAAPIPGSPHGEIVYTAMTPLPGNTTIDLYADHDNMGNDGLLIASGIPYQDGTQMFEWKEMSTFAAPGEPIFVYAVISDGENARVFSDYSSQFNVVAGFVPSLTNPAEVQTGFGDPIEFSTSQGRAIRVADPRTTRDPDSLLEVILQAARGTLDFPSVPANVTYTGNGTNKLTITGTETAINSALDGLIYQPEDNGDVQPDAIDISVTALPLELAPPVTGKIDVKFAGIDLFMDGSNAGSQFNDGSNSIEAVTIQAGVFGETPLDHIEIQDLKTEFLTGAMVKVNSFEMGKEFLELPMDVSFETGLHATFDRKNGVLTITGPGRISDYELALSEVIFETMTVGSSKSLEVSLMDKAGTKGGLTVPLNITAAPTPPTLDVGLTGLSFVAQSGPEFVSPAGDLEVANGESVQSLKFEFLEGSFVAGEDELFVDADSLNADFGSTLASQFDTATGQLTLTGTGSVDAWETALQSVTYEALGGGTLFPVTEGPRYLNVTLTDSSGRNASTFLVIDVSETGESHLSPELTLSQTDLTLAAHDTMLPLDPELTLTSEAPLLTGAQVALLDGYMQGDFELVVNGFNEELTTEWDPMEGVLTISGLGSAIEYEELLRSVEILVMAGRRDPGNLAATFSVNDGLSATESEPLNITVETAPFLQSDLNNITEYTKGRERVVVNHGFMIDTSDTLVGATVTLDDGFLALEDELIFDPPADLTNITGDFDPFVGVLELRGDGTPAEYELALTSIYYHNNRFNPSAGDRVLSFAVDSTAGISNTELAFITVTPEVIPPNVTIGQTGTFTEGGSDVSLIPDISITPKDSQTTFLSAENLLYGAEVTVTNWVPIEDELTVTPQGEIAADYNADTGRIVLSGTGLFSEYETVLESIMYRNTSEAPTTGSRDVSIRLLESAANGLNNQTMTTLSVAATPDPITVERGTIGPVTVMSNGNAVSLGLDDLELASTALSSGTAALQFQSTQLPSDLLGRILLPDGTALEAGQLYDIASLGGLKFEPSTGGMGDTTFGFSVLVADQRTGQTEPQGFSRSVAISVVGVTTKTASEAYMAQAYRDLLHKNPDAATLSNLAMQLESALRRVGRDNGFFSERAARASVIDSIVSGDDYRQTHITELYQSLLGRAPATGELSVNTSVTDLRLELLASQEFFDRNDSSGFDSYVTAVYQELLDRQPEASELSTGVQALQTGTTRADYVNSLVEPMIPGTQREAIFADLLGRAATFEDMFEFDDSSRESLAASIISSDEYFARFAMPSVSNRMRTREVSNFESVGVVGDLNGGHATGTLIAPQYVLVAAHSVYETPPGQITFTVGGTTHHIEKRFVHPDFTPDVVGLNDTNDIAILKLQQPVSGVTPSQLTGLTPKLGDVLTLVGFGQESGALFGTKRAGSTPPVFQVESNIFRWQHNNALQNDADPGDSGAPLFMTINGTPFIAGIVSGGTGDVNELGDIGTNTRVDSYLTWIQSITGSLNVADVSDPPSLIFETSHSVVEANAGEIRIPFLVTADDTATFSVSTNRPEMFRSLSIDTDGGPEGDLVFETETNALGRAQIVVTVSDGKGAVSRSLNVSVVPSDVTNLDEPLLRINSGGGVADTFGADQYANTGNLYPIQGTIDTSALRAGLPESLFRTTRWDAPGGAPLQYQIPVAPGEYQVNLYFAEIYGPTSRVGGRVFDVSIEDQLVLDNFDIFATAGAARKAVVQSFDVTADSTIDIEFGHVVENPAVMGIEIIDRNEPASDNAPVVADVSSIRAEEETASTFTISATDPDGDAVSLSASGLPAFANFTDHGNGTGTLSVNADPGDAGEYTLTIVASSGSPTLTDSTTFPLIVTSSTVLASIEGPAQPVVEGASAVFTVSLASPASSTLELDYTVTSGSAVSGLDFLVPGGSTSGTLTFQPGSQTETIEIPVAADGIHERNEVFSVTLTGGTGIRTEADSESAQAVIAGNGPVLAPTPRQRIAADSAPADLTIAASSSDFSRVAFSATSLPAFANLIDNGNGTATILLDSTTAVGTHDLTVEASDTNGSVSRTFQVDVVAAPTAPTLDAVIRINAGGGAIGSFASDEHANTGLTFSSSAEIDLTDTSLPQDTPEGIFQTTRWDPAGGPELNYSIPTGAGNFEVVLYFAELYGPTSRVGGRVFDVSIEGVQVLDDFDVFAEAGAANRAIARTFSTVSNGMLDISFNHVVENPDVMAIEVRNLDTVDLPTPPPATPNAGPSIAPLAVEQIVSGEVLDVLIGVSDEEGDPIEISLPELPDFASFRDNGDGTGLLTLRPDDDDQGEYALSILAESGDLGLTDLSATLLEVLDEI